jgi:hypothetical protein
MYPPAWMRSIVRVLPSTDHRGNPTLATAEALDRERRKSRADR